MRGSNRTVPEVGRVPSEPGSTRSAPEAPAGLRPSGDDPSRFDAEVAALIEAAKNYERTMIAIWMRQQNEASECGPFALHNASHAVESGSYRDNARIGA